MRLVDESPMESSMYLCYAKCRRFIGGMRITFCISPKFRWCFQLFDDDPSSCSSSTLK
ncbi:hypothetical protein HAX54_006679, partial [Datura stramonium]|nr:hypothetical protein [Datura stramonium]